MEYFSNPSSGLRVVAACYTRAYFPPSSFVFSSAFRATIHSQFQPLELSIFSMAFRATIHSQFQRLELSIFSMAFQSRHVFFSIMMFRVVFLSLTFMVIGLVSRSKPPLLRSLAVRAMVLVRYSGLSHHFSV